MKRGLPLWRIVVVVIEVLPMFVFPVVAMFVPSATPGLSGGGKVAFAASSPKQAVTSDMLHQTATARCQAARAFAQAGRARSRSA